MLTRLFRAIMPREERFIEYFDEHAKRMVRASDALAALMEASEADRPLRFKEVCAIEGEADVIARDTLVALHRAFITPFDRSDIHALITALDDTVDLIEDVAQTAALYKVENFSPRMREFTEMIKSSARLIAEAIPMMNDITPNAERINNLCEQIGKIESDGDRLLRLALSELIAEKPDAITFLGRKEVYDLLETVTDRCDDVANLIEGVVLDHV
jgi:predicted phosphate transport protein (TIGR00153 family)